MRKICHGVEMELRNSLCTFLIHFGARLLSLENKPWSGKRDILAVCQLSEENLPVTVALNSLDIHSRPSDDWYVCIQQRTFRFYFNPGILSPSKHPPISVNKAEMVQTCYES
ncbi:hypothetical protein J3459_009627 [Metarhizium acridum]|nr:hypothetical protein J3459_009627 [Metarhizium acridum]